jgi:hypothetical protein
MTCQPEIQSIRAGDTSEDIVVERANSQNALLALNVDYECRLVVATLGINRVVNTLRADNKAFVTALTAAESAQMGGGESHEALISLLHVPTAWKKTRAIMFETCC